MKPFRLVFLWCCFSAATSLTSQASARPGDLDTSFGNSGTVLQNFGSSGGNDFASAAIRQPDGKIVVGGQCEKNGFPQTCIVRMSASGALDATFATGGIFLTNGALSEMAMTQDSASLYASRPCTNGGIITTCFFRLTHDGTLDTSYGVNGAVVTTRFRAVLALGIQSGKLLAVGMCQHPDTGEEHMCVQRFLSDGALDLTVGSGGQSMVAFGQVGAGIATAVVVDGDKIVIGGQCNRHVSRHFCVAQLLENGAIDGTFGNGGTLKVSISTGFHGLTSLSIDGTNTYLIGTCHDASDQYGAPHSICAVRLDATGLLDPTFGVGGKLRTDIGATATTRSQGFVAGALLTIGVTCSVALKAHFCLAQFTESGAPNAAFGNNGIAKLDVAGAFSSFAAASTHIAGALAAVGTCLGPSSADFCIAQVAPSGVLDLTFGGGVVNVAIGSNVLGASAAVLTRAGNGKYLAAGSCTLSTNVSVTCVARFNPDGSLDLSFNGSGLQTGDTQTVSGIARALAEDNGRILVIAPCVAPVGDSNHLCVTRYLEIGGADTGFGNNGTVALPLWANIELNLFRRSHVAIATSGGKTFIVGTCANTNVACLLRLSSDGTFDTSFNGTGIFQVADYVTAGGDVQVVGGNIFMAYTCHPGDLIGPIAFFSRGFCVLRLHDNGTPDLSFGTNGIVSTHSFVYGETLTLNVGPERIVVSGDCGNLWRSCLASFTLSGQRELGFGSGAPFGIGIAALEPTPVGAIAQHGRILVTTSCNDRICHYRLLPDGTRDRSFGLDGLVRLSIGSRDYPGATIIDGNRLLTAGRCDNGALSSMCLSAVDLTPTLPGPPIINIASSGDQKAFFSVSPPLDDGGADVNLYTVRCNAGAIAVSSNVSPIQITGLTNGQQYSCTASATNSAGEGLPSSTILVTPSATASVSLLAVKSRKAHGTAGTFDLPINVQADLSGTVTVEPRNTDGIHTIVFQFSAPIHAVGTVSVSNPLGQPIGSATLANANDELIVTLSGVSDNSRAKIVVAGVNGGATATAALGFLAGDINSSRAVNASDISRVRAWVGGTTTQTNFRLDTNASGHINATDLSAVKARSGLRLP